MRSLSRSMSTSGCDTIILLRTSLASREGCFDDDVVVGCDDAAGCDRTGSTVAFPAPRPSRWLLPRAGGSAIICVLVLRDWPSSRGDEKTSPLVSSDRAAASARRDDVVPLSARADRFERSADAWWFVDDVRGGATGGMFLCRRPDEADCGSGDAVLRGGGLARAAREPRGDEAATTVDCE